MSDQKLREEGVTGQEQLKLFRSSWNTFLPEPHVQLFESRGRITPRSVPMKRRRVEESFPSTAAAYESTPWKPKLVIDEEEDDVEEEVIDFVRGNFDELASPYLKPYFYNGRFLDKQYGIRKEDDGSFMIGDSTSVRWRQERYFYKGDTF